MSDISKFKVGNDTYNIKDEESRNTLAETVLSTDTVPFISKTMNAGKYQRKKFVGCSYVWNQLVQNGNFVNDSNWTGYNVTLTANNNVGTVTIDGANSSNRIEQGVNLKANHVYYYNFVVTPSRETTIWFATENGESFVNTTTPAQRNVIRRIAKFSNNSSKLRLYVNRGTDLQAGDTVDLENIFIVDLTQLFGSTAIADYIYNLEQATAGAGVAKLKELGFCTEDYYAYDAGSIQSVDIKEYSVAGKNLCDGADSNWKMNAYVDGDGEHSNVNYKYTKGFIQVLGNTTYTLSLTAISSVGVTTFLSYYDSSYNFLSYEIVIQGGSLGVQSGSFTVAENIAFVRINTPKSNTNIQLEKGSTATAYEPYHKTTYSLTPTELRGVPKIDANNNIYCDGDEYASDGGHKSNYNIVDLGTLNWYYNSQSEERPFFYASQDGISDIDYTSAFVICQKYVTGGCVAQAYMWNYSAEKLLYTINNGGSAMMIAVRDSNYTSAADFKASLSGVYLVYKKATPTTETLTPFDYPQSVGSIEEITDYKVEQEDRDVAIPTGHVTEYMGKGGEFTLPTLPTTPSVLAFDGHNFFWKPETT